MPGDQTAQSNPSLVHEASPLLALATALPELPRRVGKPAVLGHMRLNRVVIADSDAPPLFGRASAKLNRGVRSFAAGTASRSITSPKSKPSAQRLRLVQPVGQKAGRVVRQVEEQMAGHEGAVALVSIGMAIGPPRRVNSEAEREENNGRANQNVAVINCCLVPERRCYRIGDTKQCSSIAPFLSYGSVRSTQASASTRAKAASESAGTRR